MNVLTTKLQEVKFEERSVILRDLLENGYTDYDIVVNDPDDNVEYCMALLAKLQTLREHSFRESFIDYQCGLVSFSRAWLISLDKLIENNIDFFYEAKKELLLFPFYSLITKRLANDPSEVDSDEENIKQGEVELIENPYDIEKTKKYLEGVWDLSEQRNILHRLKTDYQQFEHKFRPTVHLSFDEQVELELDYLKLLVQYGRQPVFDKAVGQYIQKLTVVGDLKMLAAAFRKLLEHKGDGGESYLLIQPKDFILFLIRVLQTPEGKPIDRDILIQQIFPGEGDTNSSIYKYLQTEFLNSIPKESYYTSNIDEVKQSLLRLSDYKSRVIFMYRVLTNFLQLQSPDGAEHPFVRQMNLEIMHQQTVREFQKSEMEDSKKLLNKIEINGRVNVLMTFFYDLLHTFPNKHQVVLIGNSKVDLIHFIEKNFVSRRGKDLSLHSLRSMLSPSKYDKRCSFEKQIKIQDCLDI